MAAEDLLQSQKRFDLAVKGSQDGIWDWDNIDSDEYWWSDRLYVMLGYKPGEIKPRISLWKELMHPKDKDKIVQVLQDHFKKGTPYEVEFRMRKKSGEYMWMFARGEAVRDNNGKPTRMSGSVTDITDRKQAESKLIKRESQLAESQKVAKLGSWDLDLVLQNLEWSEETYRLFDKDPQTFTPSFNEFARLVHPDDLETMQTCFNSALESDDNPYHVVVRIINDSRRKWVVEAYGKVMRSKDGKPLSIFGTAHDITELKKAEMTLADLNKELSSMIYITSHDLRSPLVNIDGYSKELNYSIKELKGILDTKDVPLKIREKITPVIEKDIAESLNYISNSVYKMNALLSGMLTLSRTGKTELVIEDIDMNEVVSNVIENFSNILKEKEIKTEITELPACRGDKNAMNQIISNLVENAVKYIGPTRDGAIIISGFKKNSLSVYCIEDNGIGISPAYQSKIFEIFHQLDPEKSEGEGLGLTIVQKLLNRLSGKIWLESETGKGSKFFLSLQA